MNIDWSKAPEDATHAGNSPYEKGVITWFKGISDPVSRNYFMNEGSMNAWAISSENLSAWDLIERPKKQEAWNGNGKPPIGIECEVRIDDVWSICKTLAYHQVSDTAVAVHFLDGSNSLFWCATFRQIKTAEQLAEEERDKARTEVLNAMTSKTMGFETEDQWQQRMKVVGEMLDMGYRKQ